MEEGPLRLLRMNKKKLRVVFLVHLEFDLNIYYNFPLADRVFKFNPPIFEKFDLEKKFIRTKKNQAFSFDS